MILFLDFDGVLHPEGCPSKYHGQHAEALAALLTQYPCEVVISSTWREKMPFSTLLDVIPSLAPYVIGITPSFKDIPQEHISESLRAYARHAECTYWMRQHKNPWDTWLALDDRCYLFTPFFKDLILCVPNTGLDSTALATLETRLST